MKDYEQKINKKTGEIQKEQACYNGFSKKSIFFDTSTGSSFRVQCTKYSCKKHGWKRKNRLVKYLTIWLERQVAVRFWTFTINANLELERKQFNKLFRLTWHRFIVELRRNKIIPKHLRKVQYVKVYEQHKSGKLHIHAFLSEYIDKSTINKLWVFCIEQVFKFNQKTDKDFPSHLIKRGNAHVKGMRSAKFGANYVAKYVVKLAHESLEKIKSWSKSGKVSLFPPRKPSNGNILLLTNTEQFLMLKALTPILVSTNADVTDFQWLLEELDRKKSNIRSEIAESMDCVTLHHQYLAFKKLHSC